MTNNRITFKGSDGSERETLSNPFDHNSKQFVHYETNPGEHVVIRRIDKPKESRLKALTELQAEAESMGLYESKPKEKTYPCDECGKLRTKEEGGTTFTVCEECWNEKPKEKTDEEWAILITASITGHHYESIGDLVVQLIKTKIAEALKGRK